MQGSPFPAWQANMPARSRKSRKRLGGNKQKPPKNFQIYLDENLQRCVPILSVLRSHGITVHQHFKYFDNPGTEDSTWLPLVGNKQWILLTTDTRLRFNEVERVAIIRYRVRVFEFSRNTKGSTVMAQALEAGLHKIINLSRNIRPPFVCTISPNGDSRLLWKPKRGETRKVARIQLFDGI